MGEIVSQSCHDSQTQKFKAMQIITPRVPHFSHQQRIFDDHRSEPFFGLFWEQGTGKTKADIDQAAQLFLDGLIDGHLVVAPDGVHFNWLVTELPAHLPDEIRERTLAFAYHSGKAKTLRHKAALSQLIDHKGLAILLMSYDGFMTDAGKAVAKEFLSRRRCLYTLDESSRVKNPAAKRTKTIMASGTHAPYRRILCGTPIANGPFDVYSQMKFLKNNFWAPHGLDSYHAFKAHFGKWKQIRVNSGRMVDVLEEYRRLDELNSILEPHTSRVLKEDVLDLPPKVYGRRVFEMTTPQRRMYEEVRDDFMTLMEQTGSCPRCDGAGLMAYAGASFVCDDCGGTGGKKGVLVSAQLAITRLLRLQQILCGYVPDEMGTPFHDIPGANPRLDTAVSWAEDLPHQGIIWTRFTRDVDKLVDALGGPSRVSRYDGKSKDYRENDKAAFLGGERQFIVANLTAMSEGHTLVNAKSTLYYSNSFKLIERLQSEDRNHRAGQDTSVNIIDLVCPGTIDEHIVDALVKKLDIASEILGDGWKSWIRPEPEFEFGEQ